MLKIKTFCFNPFGENTYVISIPGNECVIIDPGCYGKQEEAELCNFIEGEQLKPTAIWLTHTHIDHVLGLRFCEQKWQIDFYLSQPEGIQLNSMGVFGPMFGIFDYQAPESSGKILEKENLALGNETFRIFQVPGHSPGHIAFYHEASNRIWSGDVLMKQSIGRTDLPGGNMSVLRKSILENLYTLPAETIVFPGHGPETTIGFEKEWNPFINLRV